MNARPKIQELDRIRTDLGSSLRNESELEPAPHSLMALLKQLERCLHDAEGERLFAALDVCVAELVRAAGKEPSGRCCREARNLVRCFRPEEDIPMNVQIVMDTSGDTRHQFDPDNAGAVAEAERRFVELTGAGFIAATRTGKATSELVRQFDPTAQETVFIPRLVGG